MNRNKKISLFFLCSFVVTAIFALLYYICGNDSSQSNRTMVTISDSTMLDVKSYTIKKIKIGNRITNIPISSQIVRKEGKDKYMLLDESELYIFDFDSGELEDSISLGKCGNLNVYSGFNYINDDTILVYNYQEKFIFVINHNGDVFAKWSLPRNNKKIKWLPSANALNASRIGFYSPTIVVSGGILGSLYESGLDNIPVSEKLDINTEKWKIELTYTDKYLKQNLGAIYLNRIYTTTDNSGHFLYSFPVDEKVYRFNSDFTVCDTLFIQSRYDNGRVEECDKSQKEIEQDDNYEIQYFVSQLSYSNILYDPYRDLLIRVVNHPLNNWKRDEVFIQPRSFIICDANGKVLSESCILTDYSNLYFDNMHISSKGLVVAERSDDENYISFRCYNIRK